MYNRIIMVGRLTRDPEMRYLEQSGTALTKFGLASNRVYKDSRTGENKEEVCFVEVTVWGRQAETVQSYMKKGRLVLIEGRLSFHQWETDTGEKRSRHEIIADFVRFLDRGDDDGSMRSESEEPAMAPTSAPAARRRSSPPPADDNEDDIPF